MSALCQGMQLFVMLLIQPSRWRRLLDDIDHQLPGNFALCDLTPGHWQQAKLRFVLLHAYVTLPLTVLAVMLPTLLISGVEVKGSITGFWFVYLLALCTGVYISVGASVLFTVIGGIAAMIVWRGGEALMFDFTSGLHAGQLFGCCSACIIISAMHHGDALSQRSAVTQIGAIVLGLVISIPLVIAVTTSIVAVTAGRQSGALHGSWLIWTMLLPPLIVSLLSVVLKTRRLTPAIAPALFCTVLFTTGFGDMGYEYDVSVGGFALLSAVITVMVATYCMLSILPYSLVLPFVGDLPASVTAAVGGLAIHFGLKLSFAFYPFTENLLLSLALIATAVFFRHCWSVIAYPLQAAWNRLIVELDSRSTAPYQSLSRHSVSWDEVQYLPFFELEDYLIAGTVNNNSHGTRNIDSVNSSIQRWAAQAALIELDARRMERLTDINAIANSTTDESAGLLPTSAGLILRSFSRFAQDIFAAANQPTRFNQILVLRTVTKDLEQLQLELNRNYKDKVAARFVSVAEHWRTLVIDHMAQLDKASRADNEIPNPYTVGVPLTRRQKIFVGRTDIARYLEDFLKLKDYPPLLLYGPRRMGKTSLLYQLQWMLPRNVLTLIVDLQGPVGLAQNHSGFVYALTQAMSRAAARVNIHLTPLQRESLNTDPFTRFDEWLSSAEQQMQNQGCNTMLLAFDEFEVLDIALREGTLRDHAVLGTLRHVAQHRDHIKLMLVGSHTLGEFKRWAGYFVNAQVIELGYLSEKEAVQLIERPISGYPLAYAPEATARIIQFTRGHPYLVQLTCAELIAFKNNQPGSQRKIATIADVETCIAPILQRGQQFFTDIELNQMSDSGRYCLTWLASSGCNGATAAQLAAALPSISLNETLQQLEQRHIIECIDGRYCFQVEAVRLWFSQNQAAHLGSG